MVLCCCQVKSKLRSQFLGPLCLWQCLHCRFSIPLLSPQDMCYWNAWQLKVLAKKSSCFCSPCFIICSGTRIREGIRSFIDECWAAGRSSKSAHFLYVNGLDAKRSKIPIKDHLKRGASLSRLVKMWLDTWGEDTEA